MVKHLRNSKRGIHDAGWCNTNKLLGEPLVDDAKEATCVKCINKYKEVLEVDLVTLVDAVDYGLSKKEMLFWFKRFKKDEHEARDAVSGIELICNIVESDSNLSEKEFTAMVNKAIVKHTMEE